ncbi:hypothetical protein PLESTM_000141600 [Pleodorina starrii]|nr:hypothetical protein PLESTM_000141600 [Pleodorina starrii]
MSEMAGWLVRCFRGQRRARTFAEPSSAASGAVSQAEPVPATARNAVVPAECARQDAMLASTLDMDRFVEAEQVEMVTSLEDARQLILKLKARVRELEGSAGQNADTLSSLRHIRLPEQEARAAHLPGPGKRGIHETMPFFAESASGTHEGQKSVPHLLHAYTKQELVEMLSKAGKPSAAVLLQAVCEEDIGNVPPALLLDVDPAVGDAVAAAPELVAGLQGAGSAANFSQLASMERLPSYLRLRLYMMQACGARPMLAYATSTARSLFKVRTDRQLQYVLEGQVQQDAMLGMLLQEMLDEMLSTPVSRFSVAGVPREGERSTIVVHSLSHFVNTSNPKVFPFVPVTMRGCGYRKSSGEVVPCIIFEFSPDSNQGAFLEHLQRDYTMMGHISAIITLFTLKGDVLHQNAGSIAYYGFQRRSAQDKARRGSAPGAGRNAKRVGAGAVAAPNAVETSAAAWVQEDEPAILGQLFKLAPPDALEGMLESMVQGGVWRSILPVPPTLATSSRPMAAPGGALSDMMLGPGGTASAGVPPGAAFMGPDPDNVFTTDGLAFTGANVLSLAQQSADRSIGNRMDAFEGSFALGITPGGGPGGGDRAHNGPVGHGGGHGHGHGMPRSIRALNAVPEQSQECERVSFAQHRPPPGGGGGAAAADASKWVEVSFGHRRPEQQYLLPSASSVPVAARVAAVGEGFSPLARPSRSPSDAVRRSPRSVRPSATATAIADGFAKAVKVPRRSTTFSAVPSSSNDRAGGRASSGNTMPGIMLALLDRPGGAAASLPHGVAASGGSPRLSRIRRRSGLPLGLDGNPADALAQSTWGLLGAAMCDGRYDKPAGAPRDAAAAAASAAGDPDTQVDTRVSASRRFECAVQARLAAGRALGLSPSAASPAAAAAAVAATAAPPAPTVPVTSPPSGGVPGSISAAQQAEVVPPSLLSPSLSSAVDQWQQWQYRHSQWQDALQSQSQPSTAGRQATQPLAAAPATPWLLHQQHPAGFSQSSSSAANHSSVASDSRRVGGVAVAGALLDVGGAGGAPINLQSFVESVPRRQRSLAFGDGTPGGPTAHSTTRTPSAGSLVSPQPSAHQHTDRDLMSCTNFVAAVGNAPQLPPYGSPGYGQPSRFFATLPPAGSPVREAAPPPTGAAAPPAADSPPAALPLRSSSPAGQAVAAAAALGLRDAAAAIGARSSSVSVCGGGGGGGAGGLKQVHSGNAVSASVRRAPMRQSERSNPNLVLPRAACGIAAATSIKSATSFSFGSKAGHHRPLVRMMSFLNAGGPAPPASGGGGGGAGLHHQQQQQPQQHQQQPLQHAHSYSVHSGVQHRQAVRRAASGQSFAQMLEPVLRTGSGRVYPTGDGSIGTVGLSSQNGSRFPTSTFLCSNLNVGTHRRPSARAMGAAALLPAAGGGTGSSVTGGQGHPASEVDESSSLAALTTTMATVGASREAIASGTANGSGHVRGHAACEELQTFHEITATPFLDPVSKSQVVMVVQTDVTARVQLERRLADVMEAEHKLLENIFPRHVLEYIAHSAAVNQESASQFNLRMLSAMPDLTKTATDHEQVTILFADIVGFTSMCKEVPAKAVMKFLNDLYIRFDTLLDIYGVYKVETIGDCYMVAGGLISKDADGFAAVRKDSCDNLQAWRVLSFAKAMLRDAQKVLLPTTHEPVKLRVGIHTGPVVSGVVGTRMPRFCLFGDTINTASRMESTCPYGRIQVSAATHALVQGEDWEPTGGVQVKGKGIMETYLLKQTPSLALPSNLAAASMSTPGGPDGLVPPNHVSNNLARIAVRAHTTAIAAAAATVAGPGAGSAFGTGSTPSTGCTPGSGAIGGAGLGSGAGGCATSIGDRVSAAHGVVSAVTEKMSAVASGGLASGATRTEGGASGGAGGGGGRAPGAVRRTSRMGSSSGKNPSFLFNTVW